MVLPLVVILAVSLASCAQKTTEAPASKAEPTAEQPTATIAPPTPTIPAPTLTVTPQPIGTVTQTEVDCTLDGPHSTVAAGRVTVVLVNQTDGSVQFDMWRIGEGHSYAGLAGAVDKARQSAEAGGPEISHPSYLSALTRVLAPSGQSRTMNRSVQPGTYAIVCLRRFPEANMEMRPFALVGPIEVSE
jgi:hypothetical protein